VRIAQRKGKGGKRRGGEGRKGGARESVKPRARKVAGPSLHG